MKLVSFIRNGDTHIGALPAHDPAGAIVDLTHAGMPADMVTFLQGGEAAITRAREIVARSSGADLVPRMSVTPLAPLPASGQTHLRRTQLSRAHERGTAPVSRYLCQVLERRRGAGSADCHAALSDPTRL